MTEPENVSSQAESATGGGETTTQPNQEGSPETAPAGGDSPETAGKTAITDLSSISDEAVLDLFNREGVREKLLESEAVKRLVQSQKDKEIAAENRRRAEEARRQEERAAAEAELARKKRLIEEGKLEELGRLEADRLSEDELLTKSATQVAKIIEGVVRKNPEFAPLGEERINEIFAQVGETGGNVVDFTIELSKARRIMEVEAATAAATGTIEERVKAEVEARLAEAGLGKRSAEPDSGPSASISADVSPRENVKPKGYVEASEAYGRGDITSDEFEAYLEAHKKEKLRR